MEIFSKLPYSLQLCIYENYYLDWWVEKNFNLLIWSHWRSGFKFVLDDVIWMASRYLKQNVTISLSPPFPRRNWEYQHQDENLLGMRWTMWTVKSCKLRVRKAIRKERLRPRSEKKKYRTKKKKNRAPIPIDAE